MTFAEMLHACALKRRRYLYRKGIRARHDTRVGCWVCALWTWRRVYTWEPVVGQRTPVRTFGYCPGYHRYGPGDLDKCRGTMHTSKDRIRVLRAAILWDRAGMNATSEFDL